MHAHTHTPTQTWAPGARYENENGHPTPGAYKHFPPTLDVHSAFPNNVFLRRRQKLVVFCHEMWRRHHDRRPGQAGMVSY